MPYAEHIRLTAGGFLGGPTAPPEEWSCTLNLDTNGSANLGPTDVQEVWDAWAAYMAASTTTAAASLEYVKSSLVDTTGHVVGDVVRHDQHYRPGSTSNNHPFQCALVASLRTGERGPSKRGRIYLPAPLVIVSVTDGLIPEVDRDALQASVATMLSAINDAAGLLGPICIASSKGYNTNVVGVNVGRVIDTQRRRRRSLAEQFDPITPIL